MIGACCSGAGLGTVKSSRDAGSHTKPLHKEICDAQNATAGLLALDRRGFGARTIWRPPAHCDLRRWALLQRAKGALNIIALTEALAAVDTMFERTFATRVARVVSKRSSCETARSVSFLSCCADGTRAAPSATAQDHKRVVDGISGLRTRRY